MDCNDTYYPKGNLMFFATTETTIIRNVEDVKPGNIINDALFEGEKYVVTSVNTEDDLTTLEVQYIRGAEAPEPHNPMKSVQLYHQHPIPVEK